MSTSIHGPVVKDGLVVGHFFQCRIDDEGPGYAAVMYEADRQERNQDIRDRRDIRRKQDVDAYLEASENGFEGTFDEWRSQLVAV